MFIKILTKTINGKVHYYASLVENKRVNGKVKQIVKANLGPVTEDQIPYCSGRVKKATLGSDRKGQYGSGKKGQSEEKATTMVHTPYIMMSANASTI
jgi:hypothetical protein